MVKDSPCDLFLLIFFCVSAHKTLAVSSHRQFRASAAVIFTTVLWQLPHASIARAGTVTQQPTDTNCVTAL